MFGTDMPRKLPLGAAVNMMSNANAMRFEFEVNWLRGYAFEATTEKEQE
jgi:hypothetical protein